MSNTNKVTREKCGTRIATDSHDGCRQPMEKEYYASTEGRCYCLYRSLRNIFSWWRYLMSWEISPDRLQHIKDRAEQRSRTRKINQGVASLIRAGLWFAATSVPWNDSVRFHDIQETVTEDLHTSHEIQCLLGTHDTPGQQVRCRF